MGPRLFSYPHKRCSTDTPGDPSILPEYLPTDGVHSRGRCPVSQQQPKWPSRGWNISDVQIRPDRSARKESSAGGGPIGTAHGRMRSYDVGAAVRPDAPFAARAVQRSCRFRRATLMLFRRLCRRPAIPLCCASCSLRLRARRPPPPSACLGSRASDACGRVRHNCCAWGTSCTVACGYRPAVRQDFSGGGLADRRK